MVLDDGGEIPDAPFEPEEAAPYDPEEGEGGGTDEERVRRHIANLRAWADANKKDAKADFRRYWALKLPAIVSSVITAASAALGASETFVSILAGVAAICVAIDGLWPGGLLHNVHKRAVHELGLLIGRALSALDETAIAHKNDPDARTQALVLILQDMTKERERIGAYIAAAESGLGTSRRQGGEGE